TVGPRGPLDRVAQIAERKYCRQQARPFRLGFPRDGLVGYWSAHRRDRQVGSGDPARQHQAGVIRADAHSITFRSANAALSTVQSWSYCRNVLWASCSRRREARESTSLAGRNKAPCYYGSTTISL